MAELKLVMTLLVRDEADIIADNLRFHLAAGVDEIVVTDNCSEDATPEILRAFATSGRVHLLKEDADDYSQAVWVTRMARLAARELGADWVLNGDADEFFFPLRAPDLRTALAAVPPYAGVVRVPRHNFVPNSRPLEPWHLRLTARSAVSRNSLREPLPPKVAHRADPWVEVSQGNHAANGPSLGPPAPPPPTLEILHFPIRSYAQFANKIAKGGAAYKRNRTLGREVGGTWRALHELYVEGRLEEWYSAEELDEAGLAAGLASGELVEDRRVHEALSQLDARQDISDLGEH